MCATKPVSQAFAEEFIRRLLKSGSKPKDLARYRRSDIFWAAVVPLIVRAAPSRVFVTQLNPQDQPSTRHELLAIGAQYPDEQRKYPIIGLGSVWLSKKNFHGVGCLEGYARRRRLDPA